MDRPGLLAGADIEHFSNYLCLIAIEINLETQFICQVTSN